MKILCICLSSTIQRTIHFENLMISKVNRSKNYRQDASGKAVNSARVLNQLEQNCTTTLCPLGEKNLELFTTLAQKDGLSLKTLSIPGFTRECWTLLDDSANTTTELVVSEPVLSLKNNNFTQKELSQILKGRPAQEKIDLLQFFRYSMTEQLNGNRIANKCKTDMDRKFRTDTLERVPKFKIKAFDFPNKIKLVEAELAKILKQERANIANS